MAASPPSPQQLAQLEQAQADPLAQLRDIHLPGPIESWPPAPGWWVLVILACVIIGYGLYRLYQFWKKNQYRRDAIKAMSQLQSQLSSDPSAYLEAYNNLLKRVALTSFKRENVASLTGEAWVAFLDQSGNTVEFSLGPGEILVDGNYAQTRQFNIAELHAIGTAWIKNHRTTEQTL